MSGLADLLRGSQLEPDDSGQPALLVGRVTDLDPLRVVVPTLDNARDAHAAFGTPPTDGAEGDEVRVMLDEYGGLTVVAWETT